MSSRGGLNTRRTGGLRQDRIPKTWHRRQITVLEAPAIVWKNQIALQLLTRPDS
jgi:hypothetical protein